MNEEDIKTLGKLVTKERFQIGYCNERFSTTPFKAVNVKLDFLTEGSDGLYSFNRKLFEEDIQTMIKSSDSGFEYFVTRAYELSFGLKGAGDLNGKFYFCLVNPPPDYESRYEFRLFGKNALNYEQKGSSRENFRPTGSFTKGAR